jgi:hypothetical protein
MLDLTPAERERLHDELAKALGWRMFPYATVGLPDSQQRWCPPGAEVHISTCRDLPSVDELLAALRHERQLRAELETRVTLNFIDDAPISGYAECECYPGKLVACTDSVEIEIEETGHGGYGGCKHTISFPGVKTVRQLRTLLEFLGKSPPTSAGGEAGEGTGIT